jgi:hypothetical protein
MLKSIEEPHMIYQYDERPAAEQLRVREVGGALPTTAQQPGMPEETAPTNPQLDELVERVRWEMRREPVRERGRGGVGW